MTAEHADQFDRFAGELQCLVQLVAELDQLGCVTTVTITAGPHRVTIATGPEPTTCAVATGYAYRGDDT